MWCVSRFILQIIGYWRWWFDWSIRWRKILSRRHLVHQPVRIRIPTTQAQPVRKIHHLGKPGDHHHLLDRHRSLPHLRRRNSTPEGWRSFPWRRLPSGCTRHRSQWESQLLGLAMGLVRPLPCNRNRWQCSAFRQRDSPLELGGRPRIVNGLFKFICNRY